jgi:Phosphatidylinositol-specific phospholipase C, Y domain
LPLPEASLPAHVFSLSESAIEKHHETTPEDLFEHNRNHFMRTYPKGLRVSSSNLDPSVFWRKGVQMVALNWQRWDAGMMLNEGMFAGSGGWMLKPQGYRSSDKSSSGTTQAQAIAHRTLNLVVTIYAGQDLPLPEGDDKPDGFHPYVKCELHVEEKEERTGGQVTGGGKVKDGEYKCRTQYKGKGTNPDFGGEVLKFSGIEDVVEELSFVRSVSILASLLPSLMQLIWSIRALHSRHALHLPRSYVCHYYTINNNVLTY